MQVNTTLFTVLGVAVVAIMAIGMLVSQSRHKALEARNNQLRTLNLQQRRLQNLLKSLPPSYLTPELRDFLYQALLQNLKTHIELVPDKAELLKDEYKQLAEERERSKAKPPKGNKESLTADQASVYRGLLKSLHEFIKRNYETGRMKKDHAETMIKHVQLKMVETAVEFFELTADEFHAQGKFRQCRNAYQKAIESIESSPYSGQFKQEATKLRAKLNKLIEEWRASRETDSAKASNKLAGEMADMVDDQDSWKKKKDYE